MKNLVIVAALFLATSIGVTAQTAPTAPVKEEMKDMRQQIKQKRQDVRERKQDIATGNTAAAHAETQEIRGDKSAIAADRQTLQAEGVKHPVRKAKREIKRNN